MYTGGPFFGPEYFGGPYWGTPVTVPPTSIDSALVYSLKGNAGLAALVGVRIFPSVIPDTQFMPAIVYENRAVTRGHDLDGPNGVDTAEFDFWAVSKLRTDVSAIGEAVRQVLDGFTGYLHDAAGQILVYETTAYPQGDTWVPPVDGTDKGTFERKLTYSIRYYEATPATVNRP